MNKRLVLIFFILVFLFTVLEGKILEPTISLNKLNLNFGAETPGLMTDPQTFLISNTGTGILHWTVSDDVPWLDCTPVSGTNSGEITVSVNTTGIIAGSYIGTITVSDPAATNSPQVITVGLVVKPQGETDAPFGDFSTPLDGSTVQSSIPVTGWALDDLQVANVKIYLEQNNVLVFIGDAVFIEGARPDLEDAYPGYPLNYKGGWGYMMLTNFLPDGGNGTFYLHAIATDIEGQKTTLGINAITCNNAQAIRPFGTIDTPSQGGTISGNRYNNAGWVLTPQPNNIPLNGSTINVYVDGLKLGHANYNIYRSDVAGLLPNYANSNGAGASFILDTTALANGLHTIYWTAADSSGNLDGIGSRYFTIQNMQTLLSRHQLPRQQPNSQFNAVKMGQANQANHMDLLETPLMDNSTQGPGPIAVKKGFQPDAGQQMLMPGKNGFFEVNLRELERIEIHLNAGNKLPGSYQGYGLVNEQLRPLPVGSTFDYHEGIFYWQPGAGFLGDYYFLFIHSNSQGHSFKTKIAVHIAPKYSN